MQVTPKEHPIALQLFGSDPEVMGEIAKRVEDAGAAAIAVHGRTRQQYYSGTADWEAIARIKEAVSIPVIGNGDVDSPKKAEKLFRQTGCDAVMIGRAVEGNPWIFREMNHYFRNRGRAGKTVSCRGESDDSEACAGADRDEG